jgi:hypothetical protein
MRRRLPLPALLLAAACSRPGVPAAGPGAGPADARAAAAGPAPIAAEALMTHVRALAADSMEGRAIGTPGGERARAYVLRAFRDAGCGRSATPSRRRSRRRGATGASGAA